MSQHNANQNFDTKYTKIYVGDLPWTTDEEGLRSFFEKFGEIIHANVVCNRVTRRLEGYGFVTFRDAEAATRACENPNPIIDGREAKCNLAYLGARDKSYSELNNSAPLHILPNDRETKIYVAGLPWVTRTEGLKNYFGQFGEIIYANVVCDGAKEQSKGFGFVTFREAESTTRACENPNHIIDGRTTHCKLAYPGARVHNNQPNQNSQPIGFVEEFWDPNYNMFCQRYVEYNPWYPN